MTPQPNALLGVTFEGRVGWRQPQLNRRCWHPGSYPDQPWAGLAVCRGPGSLSGQDLGSWSWTFVPRPHLAGLTRPGVHADEGGARGQAFILSVWVHLQAGARCRAGVMAGWGW